VKKTKSVGKSKSPLRIFFFSKKVCAKKRFFFSSGGILAF